MAEPTAPIRWACAKHLVDLLRDHGGLDGVLVEPGWPGDKVLRRESVWLDAITGEMSFPVMTAGRRQVDDEFTVPVQLRIAGHHTHDAALSRLDEVIAVVHDVLADGASTLEDFPGVVSALPGNLVGPTAMETSSDGVVAFAMYPVEIHARLT